ncbi:ATP-dependent Clp protease proteolytic subunit [Mesorhizobium sp. L-8-3]|uniref:ATP-dependent Clp protease proteolytic subunit n=1 Tax=Mesorhizobium sp. L-8-3 TaxID=2744522 RepID=UPI0019265B1A|nr:ATP-dependent Clp protease proteolytic subunit [Mesorhizobium sp. L-8-3]BCH22580.1 ATP-dependent Clp protease proteolytic subunit [Mesorhizobium sp. L-8-3]
MNDKIAEALAAGTGGAVYQFGEGPIADAYFGFTGDITAHNASRLAANLNDAVFRRGAKRIFLHMNSLGGNSADGFFLYNHIRALPALVCIHNVGNCASAALIVFLAGRVRRAAPTALFMAHPTLAATGQGPQNTGLMSAAKAEGVLDSGRTDDARVQHVLRTETKMPEDLLQKCGHIDVYINAENARAYGIVDEVAELRFPAGSEVVQLCL